MRVYMHMYVHADVYVCMHMCVCMHACVCVCVSVHMQKYTCIHVSTTCEYNYFLCFSCSLWVEYSLFTQRKTRAFLRVNRLQVWLHVHVCICDCMLIFLHACLATCACTYASRFYMRAHLYALIHAGCTDKVLLGSFTAYADKTESKFIPRHLTPDPVVCSL